MFFLGALFFTTFFSILNSPDAWLLAKGRQFALLSIATWGIVPIALLQLLVGAAVLGLLLRRVDRFNRIDGLLLVALPIAAFALHIHLGTPLSGLLIVLLWVVFTLYSLGQADLRRGYRLGRPAVGE
jgi:hypothetical protein